MVPYVTAAPSVFMNATEKAVKQQSHITLSSGLFRGPGGLKTSSTLGTNDVCAVEAGHFRIGNGAQSLGLDVQIESRTASCGCPEIVSERFHGDSHFCLPCLRHPSFHRE